MVDFTAGDWQNVLEEFGLPKRVLAYTSNFDSDDDIIVETLLKTAEFNLQYHVPCFAKALNLAAKAALPKLYDCFGVLRRFLRRIEAHESNVKELKAIC